MPTTIVYASRRARVLPSRCADEIQSRVARKREKIGPGEERAASEKCQAAFERLESSRESSKRPRKNRLVSVSPLLQYQNGPLDVNNIFEVHETKEECFCSIKIASWNGRD